MSERFLEHFEHQEMEEKEKKPKQDKEITVTFIRHGESDYRDIQNVLKGGTHRDKTLLPDLNEKGIKNIREKAQELLLGIDKEKDLIVIWTSPELRAIGTGGIIEDVFRENGVMVIKNSEISSLMEAQATPVGKLKMAPKRTHKYFDLTKFSEEQTRDIEDAKSVMENPDIPFGEAWRKFAGTEKFEDIETQEDSKKRFNRIVNGLFFLKKIMKPTDPDKKLRFICVVHEDLPNEFLESVFGKGIINHKGLGNGETVELTIKSADGKDMVSAKHEGEKTELVFDRKEREFIYHKK